MNTPPPLPQPITAKATKPTTSEIKVSFHLDRQTYAEIQSALDEISSQLDVELTMPKFLKRTITDGWRVQSERYRKLDSKLRGHKSEPRKHRGRIRPDQPGTPIPETQVSPMDPRTVPTVPAHSASKLTSL